METSEAIVANVPELKIAMNRAIRFFDIDEADRLHAQLIDEFGLDPDSDEMLPSRVTIGVFKGRVGDMLCMLNNLGEDRALGLKAVCMRMMGDPLWQGLAEHVEATTPNTDTRESMQTLLGMTAEVA